MADAYGTMTFTKSKDCKFNSNKLLEALNTYEWNNFGHTWHFDSGYYYLGLPDTQYPTVFPTEIDVIYVNGNEDVPIKVADATEDDWDNMYASASKEIELSILSAELSKYITCGWIEIACCANEKGRYVYFELLRIHANGDALRKRMYSGPCVTTEDFTETYSASLQTTTCTTAAA